MLLYFENFEPKPLSEFGRQPKFCHGLKKKGRTVAILPCFKVSVRRA
jgi:hypothetical protein